MEGIAEHMHGAIVDVASRNQETKYIYYSTIDGHKYMGKAGWDFAVSLYNDNIYSSMFKKMEQKKQDKYEAERKARAEDRRRRAEEKKK